MNILITVYYNAPRGGLHDNIFSTCKYLLSNNCNVYVLCKAGEFEQRLTSIGVNVITTDFSSVEEDVRKISKLQEIDIIHTHPFKSRVIALEIAKLYNIPLFITFHGMYTDSIENYIEDCDKVFAVSDGIRDYLQHKLDSKYWDKIEVLRNGIDIEYYNNHNEYLNVNKINVKKSKLNIALVTRLDKDKQFIIDIFYDAVEYTYNNYIKEVKWTIVGDGTLFNEIKEKVNMINKNGLLEIEFAGWKKDDELKQYYLNSDIVLAPGRCALEAMALKKPVISIGSKYYIGLITYHNWQKGYYTNFGGLGNKHNDYIKGMIEDDLSVLINNKDLRERIGILGRKIVTTFYNEKLINKLLLDYYNLYSDKKTWEQYRWKYDLDYTKPISFEATHIGELKYRFKVKTNSPYLVYAWYIYKDDKILEKIWYKKNNWLEWRFEEKGDYKIKYFIKNRKGEKYSDVYHLKI